MQSSNQVSCTLCEKTMDDGGIKGAKTINEHLHHYQLCSVCCSKIPRPEVNPKSPKQDARHQFWEDLWQKISQEAQTAAPA